MPPVRRPEYAHESEMARRVRPPLRTFLQANGGIPLLTAAHLKPNERSYYGAPELESIDLDSGTAAAERVGVTGRFCGGSATRTVGGSTNFQASEPWGLLPAVRVAVLLRQCHGKIAFRVVGRHGYHCNRDRAS